MVKLPDQFIATKYPGYFFNIEDEKLYSMKIDGILKPLKYRSANYFNNWGSVRVKLESGETVYATGGYQISVKGMRRFYPIERLKDLKNVDAVIPVKETV